MSATKHPRKPRSTMRELGRREGYMEARAEALARIDEAMLVIARHVPPDVVARIGTIEHIRALVRAMKPKET